MNDTDNKSGESDGKYEEFVKLLTRNEAGIRRFLGSVLPVWADLDEVMQQTALVTWRKFDQFDSSTSFLKWACVVARYEAMAFARKMARDRLVFNESLLEIIADEATEELDLRKKEKDALERCLSDLDEKLRKFVILSYTPGVKVADLAEEAGTSAASFYMKLKRIRHKLMICIENKIKVAQEGETV